MIRIYSASVWTTTHVFLNKVCIYTSRRSPIEKAPTNHKLFNSQTAVQYTNLLSWLTLYFLFAEWYNCADYSRPIDGYYSANLPNVPQKREVTINTRTRVRWQERKNFPCPNCPSGFTYEKGLAQHVKYECGQKPRFKCPYCDYLSKWMNNVYKHIRIKHEGCVVRYVMNLQG